MIQKIMVDLFKVYKGYLVDFICEIINLSL